MPFFVGWAWPTGTLCRLAACATGGFVRQCEAVGTGRQAARSTQSRVQRTFFKMDTALLLFCWVFLTLLLPSLTTAQDSDSAASTVQSALQPQFTPPPPGTYALPPIDAVSDHQLL